jgi:hypothetical protein
MAEIEFKRRGTPLWLVLLVLAVLGGGAWFFLESRPDAPTVTAADSAAAVTATPGAAAPAAAAPAAPTSAVAQFARFSDTGRLPGGDADQRKYIGDAMRLMAGVLREKAPNNGVQINLLQAIADTLAMPDTKAERVPDLTQLAFFAYAYALNDAKVDDGKLTSAASQLQPNVALGKQASIVNGYLRLSRDVLTGRTPDAADTIPAPRTSAPPPSGASGAAAPKSGD